MKNEPLSEELWQAINQNNTDYDNTFYYAVKSTGIFCKPSCKSRPPKRENVRVFKDAIEAIKDGFRPCKRCKPSGLRLPDEEWIEQIKLYMDNHIAEEVTLSLLAEVSHGSPYHLQRTFKKVMDISPNEYLLSIRIEKAKKLLKTTNKKLIEISALIGIKSVPYFITSFKRKTGFTPMQYRKKGELSE